MKRHAIPRVTSKLLIPFILVFGLYVQFHGDFGPGGGFQAGVIGAAHAGWRGALDGVLEATLDAMEALGARREDIRAVIGPSISQRAYEVGPEFLDQFLMEDPENESSNHN